MSTLAPTTCAPSRSTSARRAQRAACGEHVVGDEYAFAGVQGVGARFEAIAAVFEFVVDAGDRWRQLAGFAQRHEAGAERGRERGAEDEAACFDRAYRVDARVAPRLREQPDALRERVRVGEQRRDVAEHDARRRKIRHRADQCCEAFDRHAIIPRGQ
jgi:hypothetical protein